MVLSCKVMVMYRSYMYFSEATGLHDCQLEVSGGSLGRGRHLLARS